MPALDLFPLVGLEAVANAQHEWVAVVFQPHPSADSYAAAVALLAQDPQAFAPLERIVRLADPLRADPAHFPSGSVVAVPAAALVDDAARKRCAALADAGCRVLVDGDAGMQVLQAGVRGVAYDDARGVPPLALAALPGPHWARNVADGARFAACRDAGFHWFSGAYTRWRGPAAGDGTSRRRLLALLALLARDADSRELEAVLKQDPALSYHLLKLVNSAAFGRATPIHHFGQAINVLGRRQLQRWLQLLLYARPHQDGPPDPLLPQAALRAAQMEALCKLQGGDRERQDLAFVVGVFALLDVLLAMPMAEIVAALSLDMDVVAALLDRAGPFGAMLALVEQPVPEPAQVAALGLTPEAFWHSQQQGWEWAIKVSRHL